MEEKGNIISVFGRERGHNGKRNRFLNGKFAKVERSRRRCCRLLRGYLVIDKVREALLRVGAFCKIGEH